jgi:hypothetical protein
MIMTGHELLSLVATNDRIHGCSWLRNHQARPLKYLPRRQVGIEIIQNVVLGIRKSVFCLHRNPPFGTQLVL